jgi:hypothetical protein
MSVITTVEAMPNRIEQMWFYILKHGERGVNRESLAYDFSPPSLSRNIDEGGEAGGNIFEGVLRESLSMGVLQENKSKNKETLYMAEVKPPKDTDSLPAIRRWFLDHLSELLTTPELARKANQPNMPMALSWLLLMNPSSPLKMGENYVERIKRDFPESKNAFDVTLSARFSNLFYWARYLGLCNFIGLDQMKFVIPDPTATILRLLPKIFEKEEEMTATKFIQKIGQICPVLDTGVARLKIEALASNSVDITSENELSRSMSLALQRIEAKGLITLEEISDAPNVVMMGYSNKRFTHVHYIGAKHEI